MSLWISGHERYNRKIHINSDGLVAAKGLLENFGDLPSGQQSWDLRLYNSQGNSRLDVVDLMSMATSTEIYGEEF